MNSDLLSHDDQARLRSTVSVAALERLLGVLPPEERLAVIVACVASPTRADMLALGFDVPDLSEVPELTLIDHDGRRVVPDTSFDCTIEFDDPILAALWADVEIRADD